MEKIKLKEAIVVEGRYDKHTLSSLVDTLILETRGFGIFKDKKQMALLRSVAKQRGLIVLTDSDGAGFVIRKRLISSLPKEHLKHGYIPDIKGKEKRKTVGSKEGTLGVEGMSPQVLRQILLRAGATPLGETEVSSSPSITSADFMAWGLTGVEGSEERRGALLQLMGLPNHMSKKALLHLFQSSYTMEEIEQWLKQL